MVVEVVMVVVRTQIQGFVSLNKTEFHEEKVLS